LRGSGDTTSSFQKLIQNLTAFVKRQSERSTPSAADQAPSNKAA